MGDVSRLVVEDGVDKGKTRKKICLLAVDGGGMRGIIPTTMLIHLEEALKQKSGDPEARIVDYFDIAAGSSVGGLIVSLLFAGDEKGHPVLSAKGIMKFIDDNAKQIFKFRAAQRPFAWLRGLLSPKFSTTFIENVLQKYFVKDGKAITMSDTLKPIIIPGYDLSTAGPILFNTADAKASPSWNFRLWEVNRAASSVPGIWKPARLTSLDGSNTIAAVDGGIVLNNPTGAAVGHIFNNKEDFPDVHSIHDLLILSIGTGQFDRTYEYQKVHRWGNLRWFKRLSQIFIDGWGDAVDCAISAMYGKDRDNSYLRIQVTGLSDEGMTQIVDPSRKNVEGLKKMAREALEQKTLGFSPPCSMKRPNARSNKERLEHFAEQLVQERRQRDSINANEFL